MSSFSALELEQLAIDEEPGAPDDHLQQALAQSAQHSARLAIVRWSNGANFPQMQVDAALRLSAQARWYARVQLNLETWLANGGFSAPDTGASVDTQK
ncbi:MAG: hypothetical protein V4508_11480 [Pseudomonadota bacterium]